MRIRLCRQAAASTDGKTPQTNLAVVGLICLLAWGAPRRSIGADVAEASSGAADEQQTEAEEPPPTVDLGSFRLRDFRPTRGVTADLTFSLHLQLRAGTSSAVAEAMQHWKHRLRDQAITAVRMAEMIDFSDPDLATVQRMIRVRVNRALPRPMVEQVLITTFKLDDLF